jgi:hypothetical protein
MVLSYGSKTTRHKLRFKLIANDTKYVFINDLANYFTIIAIPDTELHNTGD